MNFDFSQTYLYKIHKLTNSLDKLFDQALRQHADLGLSQFTLLLSVAQHQPVSQRKISEFLDQSPGAISRQVEIARAKGWVTVQVDPTDRRGQVLHITPEGSATIKKGIKVLEHDVFQIFDHENVQTNLMGHIDLLHNRIKDVDNEKVLPTASHQQA